MALVADFALSPTDWTAIAAHALAHRWPHIHVRQLDDVALELYRDPGLHDLPPAIAVARWLEPVKVDQHDLFPADTRDTLKVAA